MWFCRLLWSEDFCTSYLKRPERFLDRKKRLCYSFLSKYDGDKASVFCVFLQAEVLALVHVNEKAASWEVVMTLFLARIFFRDYEQTDRPEVRQKYGMLNGVIGIGFNVFLFVFKLIAGTLSHSISIMADAFNNLSDAGSSVITVIGFKLAGQEPDPEHPFGHGRLEYVSGMIVAFLILIMAYQLVVSSVSKILHPEALSFSPVIALILIVSIAVKLYMYFNNRQAGKRINSPVMMTTAADSISDAFSTSVVLASSVFTFFTGINIDGYCGVAVGLFIAKAGIEAAKDTISPLLGNPASAELVSQIEHCVMKHEGVLGIHDLVVHDYGPGRFMISLHAEVSASGNILEIHDMIDNIEKELDEELHCQAVIHMDPITTDDAYTNELKKMVAAVIHGIDPILRFHDFRIVRGRTHTNVIFDVVAPFKYVISEEDLKEQISSGVKKTDEHLNCVIQVDREYVEKEEQKK